MVKRMNNAKATSDNSINGKTVNHSRAAALRDCPLESEEQQAIFQWAEGMEKKRPELSLLMHVPNGGLRNAVVAARLKTEGTKKGFPDLFLPVARGGYHGLMIELKRKKGGALSNEQREWLKALKEQGYLAMMCKGCEESIHAITLYLEGKLHYENRSS